MESRYPDQALIDRVPVLENLGAGFFEDLGLREKALELKGEYITMGIGILGKKGVV